MMEACIYEAKLNYVDEKKDPDINKPDKLSHSKWVACEEMVYTYFNTIKKSEEYPLHISYARPHLHQALP